MNDLLLVQIINSQNELNRIKNDGFFLELFLIFQYFVQFTTFDEGHDKIQTQLILKQKVHLHKEGVLALE
jgi:hypothetical protein